MQIQGAAGCPSWVVPPRQAGIVRELALPLICLPASSPRKRGEARCHLGFRQLATSVIGENQSGRSPSPRLRGEVPAGDEGQRRRATEGAMPHQTSLLAVE